MSIKFVKLERHSRDAVSVAPLLTYLLTYWQTTWWRRARARSAAVATAPCVKWPTE